MRARRLALLGVLVLVSGLSVGTAASPDSRLRPPLADQLVNRRHPVLSLCPLPCSVVSALRVRTPARTRRTDSGRASTPASG